MTRAAETMRSPPVPWGPRRPNSVYDALQTMASPYPDRPLLAVLPETAKVYGIDAGELSYCEVATAANGLAGRFGAAGYRRGQRIGLLLENRPQFFITWFALNSLGVSVVPINPDLRSGELEYIVGHSEMVAVVAPATRHAELSAAATAAGCTVAVVDFDEIKKLPAATTNDAEPHPASLSDECGLLYTSGTTGLPKGCVLSNDYFLGFGDWYWTLGGRCAIRAGAERLLTPLPAFHMNTMATALLGMMAAGGCLIVLDRFHASTWWNSVRESRATIVHYLGVMPSILMKPPASAQDQAYDVRFGLGSGVPPELHISFEERFGFPLIEGWAMTETGSGGVLMDCHEPRRRDTTCIGIPTVDREMRIVKDDGTETADLEPGELLVRRAGPNPRRGFFDCYLKDPAATASAWEGGWFHTGDLVKRDAEGFIYFVDRKKNVIRRSGENISAVEVELALLRYPLIKTAAVCAVPDDVRGDEVAACVILKDQLAPEAQQQTAEDIVRFCLSRFAYYKAPGYVAFVDELPLTATQKIQRGALKAFTANAVGSDTGFDLRALKRRRPEGSQGL